MLSALPRKVVTDDGKTIMRSDVTIEVRDDLLCSGVLLPAGESFSSTELSMPKLAHIMDAQTNEEGTWVRTGDNQALFISNEALPSIDVEQVDALAWRLNTIYSGIPSLYESTIDKFVPQMVNMQQVGGLSFTHGCYPGQEIVARMQYLGKLKRQMFRYAFEGTEAPAPGTAIASTGDQEAGIVVDAVATDEGVQLLAVMKLSSVDEPLSVSGQPLMQQALPYDLSPVD